MQQDNGVPYQPNHRHNIFKSDKDDIVVRKYLGPSISSQVKEAKFSSAVPINIVENQPTNDHGSESHLIRENARMKEELKQKDMVIQSLRRENQEYKQKYYEMKSRINQY